MAEPRRVLVAMSGGVDSSVAAALLVERGFDLVGVTLHLWDASGEEKVGRCCAPEDRDDARRTCDHLGIPHYVFDERASFRRDVVEPFIESYVSGATPSPCVTCNKEVKLGRLAAIADELGASHIATGHYARIEHDAEGSCRLFRGRDRLKDQSYFLYGVSKEILGRMVFPLGHLEKDQTRNEGKRLGVPNWDKGDSQELCFVPDGDIGGFIERQTGASRAGRLLDRDGGEVGRHQGHYRYTVGQRRGLGLGGGGVPRYVLQIVGETGDVVVGSRDELLVTTAMVAGASWREPLGPGARFSAEVQVRHRHRAAPAEITALDGGRFHVAFATPQRAVAPGQAAVVYREDQVLGGGQLVPFPT